MTKRFVVGGTIQDRSRSVYVARSSEDAIIQRIVKQRGPATYSLEAHRQMGKSSFLRRLQDHLAERGWTVCSIDLRGARYGDSLNSAEFAERVIRQLMENVPPEPDLETWLKKRAGLSGALVDPLRAIQEAVNDILAGNRPTLFIVDEFEAVSEMGPFVQSLFDASLACEGSPRAEPLAWLYAGTQSATTLVAAEKSDPSKFPNFISLELGDLSATSTGVISALTEGLSFASPSPKTVCEEVIRATGGQPFLTCLILDRLEKLHLEGIPIDLDAFLDSEEFLGNSHFEYALQQLKRDSVHGRYAVQAYSQMLEGKVSAQIDLLSTTYNKDQTKLLLMQSGLVRDQGDGTLLPRSPVYRKKYNKEWVSYATRQLDAALPYHFNPAVVGMNLTTRARIGIINAGGTMGMDYRDGNVIPPQSGRYWYHDFQELWLLADFVDFNVVVPTDGVNIGPHEWEAIATEIFNNLQRSFDGFIVIMGTDSLAYAASAVAFALGTSISIPVVFTGSQAPHAISHGDARTNLLRSVQVISHLGKKLPEVVVLFNDEVYRAVRTEKLHDFRFGGFHSPSFPPLAIVGESPKLTNIQGRIEHSKNSDDTDRTYRFYPKFDDNVLRISLYPGLRHEMLLSMLTSTPVNGLILECLGIGNVPTTSDYNLLEVVDHCRKESIPVLISGRYPVAPEFSDQYEAATKPLSKGAIAAGNMTPAASLTKFMWVLARVSAEARLDPALRDPGQRLERIRRLFEIERVGELD